MFPFSPKSLLLFFFFAYSISGFSAFSSEPSIYEILRSHGLPMGLLPKGVTEFNVDETGRFEVYLDQACNAKFESELHYDRNVSGTLSYGQIGALSGITAQELFLWFPVKGIRVDVPSSGLIYFDVGVVFKQFSLSLFETPPDCWEVRSEEMGEIRDGRFKAEAASKFFLESKQKVLLACFVVIARLRIMFGREFLLGKLDFFMSQSGMLRYQLDQDIFATSVL